MRLLALAVCTFLAWIPASANTYYVFPDGSGDFPTIQAAVDAASSGDVIRLGDGTFTGPGNRDVDYLGKTITIESASGDPEACRIDCQGTGSDPHRGFSFVHGETSQALLRGVTIANGDETFPNFGSAILISNESGPSIESCIISNNVATAIWADMDCSVSLRDCRFLYNTAPFAAGLYMSRGSATIERCAFIGNEAENSAAINCYCTAVEMRDCLFSQNRAMNRAAATFCDNQYVCAVDITDCVFSENSSDEMGATLNFWISGPNTVERCTFYGNTAGYGCAAMMSEKISDTYVRNCTFWGNSCPNGTIWAGNRLFEAENTIIANDLQGPGLVSVYDYATLRCCDIYGNAGGDWVGAIAEQYGINGNICADPLLCDPDNGNFMLECSSPCAPFSSHNPECDLVGAWPVGCGPSPVNKTTWGGLKLLYRR